MKRGLLFMPWILVFSFWGYSIHPSYVQDEEVVKVQIYRSYDRIHPGMDLKIALRVDILGTWHINSHVPTEDYMEATNVAISAESSFSFSEVEYPKAFSVFVEFSERPISVYEGEIFIVGTIPIPEDIILGTKTIPLRFTYQACNDVTCLASETLEEEITFTIVDKETPIQKINIEIFAKLDMEVSSECDR
jgi:hypothetical protein